MVQNISEETESSQSNIKAGRLIEKLASAEISLLGIQFVLGMILNLFIVLPPDGSLTGVAPASLLVLVLHIGVAFALVGTGIGLILFAIRSKSREAIVGSSIVILGVLISFLSGAAFLFAGQNNAYSFIMAIGFLVATVGTQRVRFRRK